MTTCGNCGKEVREGLSFCTYCAAPITQDDKQRPSPQMVAMGIVIVAALFAVGVLIGSHLVPRNTVHVVTSIIAPEYKDGDSPIPLRIVGVSSAGSQVNTVVYVSNDDDGFDVEPGEYEVTLAASPLCESGGVYQQVGEPVSLSVTEEASRTGTIVVCPDIELAPVSSSKVSAKQIQEAYDLAIESGFSKEKSEEYLLAAQSSADEAGPEVAYGAFNAKLESLVEQWGYPTVREAAGQYISGLAFMRLVDFGDGQERLVLAYYDPAGDRDNDNPGGYPESYPVEVWEYDPAEPEGLRLVHESHAQLDGQNVYCTAIAFSKAGEKTYLSEWDNVPGPAGYSWSKAYGLLPDGSFGCVLETRIDNEYDAKVGEMRYRFSIDGEAVSEEEFVERSEGLQLSPGETYYLTALPSSDRDVQATLRTAEDTLMMLAGYADYRETGVDEGDDGAKAESANAMADLPAINRFLSNYSEVYIPLGVSEVDVDSPPDAETLAKFGVFHCGLQDANSWEYASDVSGSDAYDIPGTGGGAEGRFNVRIDADLVEGAVERYFGCAIDFDELSGAYRGPYHYQDGYVYFGTTAPRVGNGVAYATEVSSYDEDSIVVEFDVYGPLDGMPYDVSDDSLYASTPDELMQRFNVKDARAHGTALVQVGESDGEDPYSLMHWEIENV